VKVGAIAPAGAGVTARIGLVYVENRYFPRKSVLYKDFPRSMIPVVKKEVLYRLPYMLSLILTFAIRGP
jgi:hypothetical protein